MAKKKAATKKPAPEQTPPKPAEPTFRERWDALWSTLIAIEVRDPTYGTVGTTLRADNWTHLTPVLAEFKVIGVLLSRTNKRTGEPEKIQHFLSDSNIKGYQFGEQYAQLTSMDLDAADTPIPTPESDDEVLQRTEPRKVPIRPKVRKTPEGMAEDIELADDVDQMADIKERMAKARAEEEAYNAIEDKLDVEVLEGDAGQ